MREIKFRAWDKKEKTMDEPFGLYAVGYLNGENGYDAKHYILLQYTGLKDKNNVEIYEGDIIKGLWDAKLDYSEQICTVEFLNGAFVETYFNRPVGDFTGSYHRGNTIEVIGNIYENPELLKEEI